MKKMHIITALVCAVFITLGGNSFAAQSKSLNLFGWSEYIPQAVLDGFTKETGIKVNYETYGSNEEMLAKLLPSKGKYDLIIPSEYVVEALIKRNKLEPLDMSKIPNFKNIGTEFKGFPFDPENKYSVPYMTGSVGIVVNTEKVKDDIKGYKDVFQPKFKNRIVVLNDNREIVSWALSTEGIDINDVTPATIEKIKPTPQGMAAAGESLRLGQPENRAAQRRRGSWRRVGRRSSDPVQPGQEIQIHPARGGRAPFH